MNTEIIIAPSPDLQPAPLFTPTPKAAQRVLEFFTGQINNDHTRRASVNATRRFAAWCAIKHIDELSPPTAERPRDAPRTASSQDRGCQQRSTLRHGSNFLLGGEFRLVHLRP